MKVGLLWFDDDPQRGIEEKVQRAAQRYRERFGRLPNVCYVNPIALPQKKELRCGRVRIIAAPNVLPHHFWVGVSDRLRQKKGRKAD